MTLVNWGNISREFEWFINKITNFQDYWDGVLDIMEEEKDKNFKTEWANMQITWRRNPLSPTTQKLRAQRSWYYKNPSNKPWILRWTGNLQEKIARKKNAWSCAMLFQMPYAIDHQAWKWRMKRPLFEFSPKVKAEIIRSIQTEFNKRIWIRNSR